MKNNIKEIIKKYLEYYPQEKDNLSKLIELVNNEEDVSNLFNRKNFKGHITASGFIYCKSERKLLLLEHKALNKYIQPGGHVEKEDNQMIDAAKREIKEETGLSNLNNISIINDINIPFDINSHYIPENVKKMEDGHYHHDFRYLFTVDNIENINIDYNESNNYKWVSIDDIINDDNFGLSIKKIVTLIDENNLVL